MKKKILLSRTLLLLVFCGAILSQPTRAATRSSAVEVANPKAIPPRDPAAKPQLIDLSKHYNAALTDVWHGDPPGNDLSTLPPGIHKFGGTEFDIRGIVQLSSRALKLAIPDYPEGVNGIQVGLKARRLHFGHPCGLRMAPAVTRI